MGKLIYVVDDDLGILEVIKVILEENNFQVETFNKCLEAFNQLKKKTPDLILMDMWMVDMDGREFSKKLRSDPKLKSIPLVVVSALNNMETISKEIGADSYLAKPFEIEDLLKTIKSFTRN